MTGLHLILGDEEFLVARAIAAVPRPPTAEVHDLGPGFTPGGLTVGGLLAAVSPSLFGDERIVVLHDAQDFGKDLAAAVLAYVKAPEPDVTLIVAHAGGVKGKALADGLKSAGATVTGAAKLKPSERVAFANDEIRRFGGKFVGRAAEALVDAIGSDLRSLSAACGQLVADTGGRVDAATVALYYKGRAEVRGYAVADAVMAGDLPAALSALRWMLNAGESPVVIAAALAEGVRQGALVMGAGRGDPPGMPPWKVEPVRRRMRSWTPAGVARAAKVTGALDAAVKGEAGDPAFAVEQAVFAIAAARG